MKLAKRALGAIGAIAGRRKAPSPDLDPPTRSFRHIWGHLERLNGGRRPLKRSRQIVLVLQMGKVGSMAIRSALHHRGLNVFHTHSVSLAGQKRMVEHLALDDFTFLLASHELGYHIKNVTLHMLVRWFSQHHRYAGRSLKVVTLTRDPTTFFRSEFIQRLDDTLAPIRAWQAARLGQPEASVDSADAVRSFVEEVMAIIVAAGVENADACAARAAERWPEHPVVAREARTWLRPLTWFDIEIGGVFGLDVLAAPTFRTEGWAMVENAWVSILLLRFEQLVELVPRIGAFTELPDLALTERNVTARKAKAVFQPAIAAAIDTPTGQAFLAALRASPYARACGYDRANP